MKVPSDPGVDYTPLNVMLFASTFRCGIYCAQCDKPRHSATLVPEGVEGATAALPGDTLFSACSKDDVMRQMNQFSVWLSATSKQFQDKAAEEANINKYPEGFDYVWHSKWQHVTACYKGFQKLIEDTRNDQVIRLWKNYKEHVESVASQERGAPSFQEDPVAGIL